MIAYSKINIREDRIVTMKDDRVFLLTGAAGFLGNNIAKQLYGKRLLCTRSCIEG